MTLLRYGIRTTISAFVLLGAPEASADLRTRIFVGSPILGIPNMAPSKQSPTGPLTDDYFFLDKGPYGEGEIASESEIDYGVIRLLASMRIEAGSFDPFEVSTDSGVSADGSFSDFVTIYVPELDGQAGTFVPVIRVAGSLSADASGSHGEFPNVSYSWGEASWVLTFSPGSQQRFGSCNGNASIPGECTPAGDAFGTYELNPVTIVFGSPFMMGVSVGSGTFQRTVPRGMTDLRIDMGSTISWKGFKGVFDGDGRQVARYSVESDSGIDWSQAVPEPAAGFGAFAALLTLCALRARTKPHRAR